MLLRHALTRPEPGLPRTLRPATVGGEVAYSSLRAAGHLVELTPGVAVLAGTAVTRTDRLAALGPRIPPRTVVGRLSAVWVHTGRGAPGELSVLYAPGTHRPPGRPDLRTHQATLAPADVEGLPGLHVTSPLRTAVDVARHVPRDLALAALTHLWGAGLATPAQMTARLREHRASPCTSEALDIIAELAAREGRGPGPAPRPVDVSVSARPSTR